MKIKDKTHEPRTRTRYLGKRAKQRQWQRVIGQKGREEWEIEHLAETVAVFYFDAFFWLFFFSVLRVVYLIVLRHDDDTAQSI